MFNAEESELKQVLVSVYVSEQSQPLDLCTVHLLAKLCHVRGLIPLHLPREILYLDLQLSLLVLKLHHNNHTGTTSIMIILTFPYKWLLVSSEEIGVGIRVLQSVAALTHIHT